MPRGGARVGAGRKPKRPLAFTVIEGARENPPSTQIPLDVSSFRPSDLPAEQRRFWDAYAPLAIERRTLTAQTVPAFRLLCELEAEKEGVKRTIDQDGRTYLKVTIDGSGQEHQELKAHPLKTDYARLAKHVSDLMLKFMLSPFGKPAGPAAKSAGDVKRASTRAKFFGATGA